MALNKAMGASHPPSPRIVPVPVFDPFVFETGRQTGRIDIQTSNIIDFFIEGMQGNDVVGRIVPMTGLVRGTGGGGVGPEGSFLRAIRLAE